MGLTAKKTGGGDYPPIPEGVHHAICYGIWDIGTHFIERFSKDAHQCIIAWELPEERITIEDKDLPRAASKKFTVSLHEKAELRKYLELWRGKAFTESELEGFDVKAILGANCFLQIIHKKKDNKTFANVVGVTPIPKGTAKRQAENTLKFFSFEDGSNIPEGTPDWISDQIKSAKEWGGGSQEEAPPVPDEEIPF